MHECVILFSHYKNCEVTRRHLELLRQSNGTYPIVPIYCEDGRPVQPVAGAIRVPKTFERGNNWHNGDAVFREWFRGPHRIDAERYMWIEWDCQVTVPVAEWYSEVWRADAAATWVPRPPMMWDWFQAQGKSLPQRLQPHAAGVVPLNGILLSRRALETIAAEPLLEGIFCELRVGTMLRAHGFEIAEFPIWKGRTNIYLSHSRSVEVAGRGLFHPVKNLQ